MKPMIRLLVGAGFLLGAAADAAAQLDANKPAAKKAAVTASLIADLEAVVPGKPITLAVKLEVPKGTYTYFKSPGSIGLPTRIRFGGPAGFQVGPPLFPGPEVKYDELGGGTDVSYVYKRTTLVLSEVLPPASLKAGGKAAFTAKVSYQYCEEDGSCYPPTPKTLTLELPIASADDPPKPSKDAAQFALARKSLPTPGSESRFARVSAALEPPAIAPGGSTTLVVTVDVEPGYKLQMNRPAVAGLISTDLVLEETPGLKRFPLPTYPPPLEPQKAEKGFESAKEYRGRFQIKVPVAARDNLTGEKVTVSGLLRYQACNVEGTCYPPIYASFEATGRVDPAAALAPPAPAGTQPGVASSDPTSSSPARGVLANLQPVDAEATGGSLGRFLLLAFVGGLILNVMPCVLPVIAIKVLSFVQQAGEDRRRIFFLNVAYAAGVISVFLCLAGLAVFAGYGWGGLFQKPEFNLVMAGLVFSMGLSLLGVFEIPVPGLAGSISGDQKEGPTGAFLTGVLATLLATPCSGPFLGVTLGWSVRQTPATAFLVWGTMGLGMASPYLLFALFPRATRWLPKPGNWMVTFKEAAGLVLMGTVVFIIWYLDETYIVPVLVMLLGLTLGFWMIGNLYDHSTPPRTRRAIQTAALVLTAGICAFALTTVREWAEDRRDFRLLAAKDEWLREQAEAGIKLTAPAVRAKDDGVKLPWEPFTEERLTRLVDEGKTVLVDFSADWCLTCKTNEANALNTAATRKLVDQLGAAALYADFTHDSPEIRRWLDQFDSISVPLTVIFPGKDPKRPIVLRDLYSQATLLAKLREAGPSVGVGKSASGTSLSALQ